MQKCMKTQSDEPSRLASPTRGCRAGQHRLRANGNCAIPMSWTFGHCPNWARVTATRAGWRILQGDRFRVLLDDYDRNMRAWKAFRQTRLRSTSTMGTSVSAQPTVTFLHRSGTFRTTIALADGFCRPARSIRPRPRSSATWWSATPYREACCRLFSNRDWKTGDPLVPGRAGEVDKVSIRLREEKLWHQLRPRGQPRLGLG